LLVAEDAELSELLVLVAGAGPMPTAWTLAGGHIVLLQGACAPADLPPQRGLDDTCGDLIQIVRVSEDEAGGEGA
jgi:hypothetical protein